MTPQTAIYVQCNTCLNAAYPVPEVDGVPTVSPDTLTLLRTTEGTRAVAICTTCAGSVEDRSAVVTTDIPPGSLEMT